jgi:hypothetical protein
MVSLPRRSTVKKISGCAAMLITSVSFITVATAAPASASASGCTWAPGYTGAVNCIAVTGTSNRVTRIRSEYVTGFNERPDNICNRSHQASFTLANDLKRTLNGSASGCSIAPPGTIARWDWTNPPYNWLMKDRSKVCARTKNSHTGYEWSSGACITIKK